MSTEDAWSTWCEHERDSPAQRHADGHPEAAVDRWTALRRVCRATRRGCPRPPPLGLRLEQRTLERVVPLGLVRSSRRPAALSPLSVFGVPRSDHCVRRLRPALLPPRSPRCLVPPPSRGRPAAHPGAVSLGRGPGVHHDGTAIDRLRKLAHHDERLGVPGICSVSTALSYPCASPPRSHQYQYGRAGSDIDDATPPRNCFGAAPNVRRARADRAARASAALPAAPTPAPIPNGTARPKQQRALARTEAGQQQLARAGR